MFRSVNIAPLRQAELARPVPTRITIRHWITSSFEMLRQERLNQPSLTGAASDLIQTQHAQPPVNPRPSTSPRATSPCVPDASLPLSVGVSAAVAHITGRPARPCVAWFGVLPPRRDADLADTSIIGARSGRSRVFLVGDAGFRKKAADSIHGPSLPINSVGFARAVSVRFGLEAGKRRTSEQLLCWDQACLGKR